MKIKNIYINFEGVLADFDGRIKELWGISYPDPYESFEDEYNFWEKIRNEKDFYKNLSPLPGSLEMLEKIYKKYGDICVIVSDDHIVIRDIKQDKLDWAWAESEKELEDKTAWVYKYFNESIKYDWILGAGCCQDAGDILIDSRVKKINEWKNDGGTGIIFRSPQETLKELEIIEEEFSKAREELCRAKKRMFADKVEELVLECKGEAAKIESKIKLGQIADKDVKNEKVQIAEGALDKLKKICDKEEIDWAANKDCLYQTFFDSVGVPVKKVPIRHYPMVKPLIGSIYRLGGFKNVDTLFYDDNPIGKMFKFKKPFEIGEELILIDYYFKIKSESFDLEKKGASWEGWRCFSGSGKLEGYRWADGSIHIREYNGEIQCVAWQKTYFLPMEPIWKRRSAFPVDEYTWIGRNEDIPDNLEIPEGEYYYDETANPPRGCHYKEHGILAYDDTDEIVILGIKDTEAEIVEIPPEINGKPVTVLDERCFENCYRTLKKVILPNTLKEIGDYAFVGCEALEKPIIPDSVVKIGKNLYEKYYKG